MKDGREQKKMKERKEKEGLIDEQARQKRKTKPIKKGETREEKIQKEGPCMERATINCIKERHKQQENEINE